MSKILIVGGSGLLGESLIKMYMDRGDIVYVIDKDKPSITPDKFIRVKFDPGYSDEGYKAAFDSVSGADTLITTLGISHLDWLEDLKAFDIRNSFEINTIVPIMAAKYFIKAHKYDKEGNYKICFTVSTGDQFAMRTSICYNTGKAALAMAVKQIGKEVTGRYPQFAVFGISPCSFGNGQDNIGGIIEDIIPQMLTTRPEQFPDYESAKKYNLQSPTGSYLMVDDLAKFMISTIDLSNVHMNGSVFRFNDGCA